jgi:hypothetical protein
MVGAWRQALLRAAKVEPRRRLFGMSEHTQGRRGPRRAKSGAPLSERSTLKGSAMARRFRRANSVGATAWVRDEDRQTL